jgi:hypothetical protein
MDTFNLSKDIFSKLADISGVKTVQNSNMEEIICEYIQDNKAKLTFFNGTVYEGPVVGGKLHGKGVLSFSDKSIFKGQFESNRILGKGEIQYSEYEEYKGEFVGFSRHGFGVYEHRGHNIKYEGNWENDVIHGKGRLEMKDQWVYNGDFKSNMKHGHGELEFESGTRYKGEFYKDQKHGKGIMRWKNPDEIYDGEWNHDRLEGFGVYIYQNLFSENRSLRNYYKGYFRDGKRSGLGVHFYSDGSFYIGEWKENEKHGKAVFIDGFGERFKMAFEFNGRIQDEKMKESSSANKRLGFVLDLWKPSVNFIYKKRQIVNFILNFKKIFKGLFRLGMTQFRLENEESHKLTLDGVIKLLKKIKVYNRKSGKNLMIWIMKQSEHNYVYTAYSKHDIKVESMSYLIDRIALTHF